LIIALARPIASSASRSIVEVFGAQPRERARRFRKPHVVADRNAEAAHVWHVESDEVCAWRDSPFVREEWKHLAIAGDDDAVGIDDRRGVEHLASAALAQRSGHQPKLVALRRGAQSCFRRTGQRLSVRRIGPQGGEFSDHGHRHPRKAAAQQVQLGIDLAEVVTAAQLELQACNSKLTQEWFPPSDRHGAAMATKLTGVPR
jgi:hypothetical protein